MASLTPSDRRTIDKFCYQCLQLQSPDYPDAGLMRRAEVQDEIFDRICQRECSAVPNLKFQLRILKKLAALIEAGMIESESDEYVSNRLRPCCLFAFVLPSPKFHRLTSPMWLTGDFR